MYNLRMTNLETLEIIEKYYETLEIAAMIFEDRINVLDTVYFEKYELELLDEKGACLAYADGNIYGGLLWKVDVDEEEWGDWDWTLLKEWAENGISAPIPKPDWDTYYKYILDDFGIDEDYIEEWGGEFDEDDFDQETQGFSHGLFAEEEW